jgi:V/A-type H+-transporting ATPase subunit E
MKTLEKGQDKISKICAVLRNETIEPAQKEAQTIIEKARLQADQIVVEAKLKAEKMHKDAKVAIEQEENVFQSSLQQGIKQSLESLRQNIESKFFNENLSTVIERGATDPQLVANLINAIVKALEKDGLAVDLTAIVSKKMDMRKLNELLLKEVVENLKNKSIEIGNFKAGIQLKLSDKNMTIDISDAALKELLGTYIARKDFRKMVFESHT